ncbi:hypothetical protein C0995_009098 [Termitomyces sp. Mi166|nr:hypothetical protein C0995_009098 [Termitomyces sp. Mi166\
MASMPVPEEFVPSSTLRIYHILAGQLFDSVSRNLCSLQAITIDRNSGVILKVQPIADLQSTFGASDAEEIIDLLHLTTLPGFVDTHVHLFLHSYSETSWDDQVTKESLPERTLRAGVHARKTLMAGYTTVRDLGTEGAEDADIALRKCLAILPGGKEPIIVGPRYYCSTRAIVSTGSYGKHYKDIDHVSLSDSMGTIGPKSSLFPSQNGIDGITGAEAADGIDACIKAVRRQVGAGADWIKIYADYTFRSRMADVSAEIGKMARPLFTRPELKAMIDCAHDLGVKVAAHAHTTDVIEQLLELGVDSVEHGAELFDNERGTSLIKKWAEVGAKTFWVPTLSVYYHFFKGSVLREWERAQVSFEKVLEFRDAEATKGRSEAVRISCGGDTGAFPHGENGLEMVLMRRLGARWEDVLAWGTLGGWESVRGMEWEGSQGEAKIMQAEAQLGMDLGFNDVSRSALDRGVPFGAIRTGWAADLVGVEGKMDGGVEDFEAAIMQGVRFVMKGGTVYMRDGKEVL